jgi:hypothetical protein
MSDAALSSALTTLAVASASDVLGLGPTQTALWSGQSVSGADVLVMYTYSGDGDLSGQLDADDYFIIDSNYSKSGSVFGFGAGDFNYDGLIDGEDYFLLDSSFGHAAASLATAAGAFVVPEPSGFAITLVGWTLLRRRRDHH